MNLASLQTTTTELIGPQLANLRKWAGIAAGAGLLLCVIGLVMDPPGAQLAGPGGYPAPPPSFFPAYLYAYLFWIGVTVGSLAFLMLHHVVGGGWGYVIRRFWEAAVRLLPAMALLFAPVLVGLLYFDLFVWTTDYYQADPVVQWKAPYLNVPFFILRAVFYFAVWIGLGALLLRWGAALDRGPDPAAARRLQLLSAGGIVAYALTVTFATVDWVMSLEPHWFSTMLGMLMIGGQGLATLALMLALVGLLAGDRPLVRQLPGGYFRDLGNLMLAFVLLWAYLSFSQYLIIWSGDVLEFSVWYLDRAAGGWGLLAMALIAFHFALPFLVLLVGSRLKQDPRRLAMVAALLVLMRFVDLFWWVAPTFREQLSLTPADLGAPLLIGGIWLWLWVGKVLDRPVVPLHDPRVETELREVSHG